MNIGGLRKEFVEEFKGLKQMEDFSDAEIMALKKDLDEAIKRKDYDTADKIRKLIEFKKKEKGKLDSSKKPESLAEEYYDKAVRLYKTEAYNEAMVYWKKAIEEDPTFLLAYFGAGLTELALENPQEAEFYADKILELEPENPYAYLLKAQINLTNKNLAEAKSYCKKVLERCRDYECESVVIDRAKEIIKAIESYEAYSKEISQLIKELKTLKDKRNQLTAKVKESKKERENYNELIKQKIEEVKKLRIEKNNVAKKYHITEDPMKIKATIEQLEAKIETNVMSFEKEQSLMKKIKELKKKYKEAGSLVAICDKIHKVSKEIDIVHVC